jgi:hypothetical protein
MERILLPYGPGARQRSRALYFAQSVPGRVCIGVPFSSNNRGCRAVELSHNLPIRATFRVRLRSGNLAEEYFD